MSTLVIADETPGGKRAAKFKADGKHKSDEHKFWWLLGASLRTDTLLVSQEAEHRLKFKLPGGDVCSTDSLGAVNDYLRKQGKNLHELQIWAHGSAARPFIGERPIEPEDFLPLKQAGVFADNGVIWFRCCSVAEGNAGRKYLKAVAQKSGARFVAGHDQVIGGKQHGCWFYDAHRDDFHGPYDVWSANPYSEMWKWLKDQLEMF